MDVSAAQTGTWLSAAVSYQGHAMSATPAGINTLMSNTKQVENWASDIIHCCVRATVE